MLLLASTSVPVMSAWAGVLVLVELAGPVVAEKRLGGTPWHAHHVAERYALMVIIALGEGLLGTMALLTAFVGPGGGGWSVDVAVLAVAGTALTFGMWWVYFILPSGAMLHARRERSFGATDEVVGIHMIGPDAPEILQAAAIAVTAKLKKADFDRTIALHPTMAEELVLMR